MAANHSKWLKSIAQNVKFDLLEIDIALYEHLTKITNESLKKISLIPELIRSIIPKMDKELTIFPPVVYNPGRDCQYQLYKCTLYILIDY